MSVDDHIGPTVPVHRFGHCCYDPSMSRGYECGSIATTHLLVAVGDGTEMTTFTCDEHLALATKLLSPLDSHPVAYDCVKPPPVLWQWSTPERVGWCFTNEDDSHALAEAATPSREMQDA